MILVDSHCHLDAEEFDFDRAEAIERARENGVAAMLVIGTGEPLSGNFERAVSLAEAHPQIFAAVGVHPHDAKTYDDAAEKRLIGLIHNSKKIVAWGEIGLDFYYDHSPREVQFRVFRRQINIARQLELPIIIHSRDADDETTEILLAECSNADFAGGVMHCFGGSAAMAERLMNVGFYISFAGNVTFKKAENLREAARVVPLERLLVETDCPYLAPIPFRGRRNEPAFVRHTAEFLADFYQIAPQELAQSTTANFERLFSINLDAND